MEIDNLILKLKNILSKHKDQTLIQYLSKLDKKEFDLIKDSIIKKEQQEIIEVITDMIKNIRII